MAARRLLLSVDELAVLCREHAVRLPPPFLPVRVGAGDARAREVAREHLVARGLLDGAAGESVARNLGLLTASRVALRTDVVIDHESISSLIAIGEEAGATIAHAYRSAVELSLWPAGELPHEVSRLVPGGGPRGDGRPVAIATRALIGALGVAADRGHDAAEMLLVREGVQRRDADQLLHVAATTHGSLHAIVTGRATGGTEAVALGHVVWLLSGQGWQGIRRLRVGDLALAPVVPADLGRWLAPYVAELVA
ncbi:MAG: hypothetical protein QOG52_2153 [Frankiaceae bacterium]|jgi:hypothetical protein|nr:hypothetical protein [Frankiaceae bacterium]